ncbi:MAG TPA: sulfite exporter TauE/SafE family protein [Crocinitomix sp.]|nr:sulfite exporter TauE/SafE family protein [Crocinitomix sp.]
MIWSAFLLGLAGSLHCVGMCGPIALMIPTGNGKQKWLSLFLYHSGKILTYLIIGTFFGLIVSTLNSYKTQIIFTFISGGLLILFGLLPVFLNWVEKKGYQFFNNVINFKTKLAKSLNKNKIEYSFYIGFLNGFLPCAMVYSAAIMALAQKSFMNSLIIMLVFGLGTIPLLSVFYFFSNKLKSKLNNYANIFRTFSFIIVGVFLMIRGVYYLEKEPPKPLEGGNSFKICYPF